MKNRIKTNKFINIFLISGIILLFLFVNIYFYNRTHGDLGQQQEWGNIALNNGLCYLYENHITDYPPLYQYIFLLNSWINNLIFKNINTLASNYIIISKIIPVLCNLIIGIIIFLYYRKKNFNIALVSLFFYLFNLGLIYNTSIWAQIDSVNTLFMFLSIVFLLNKKFYHSSFLLTLAILIKIQSIVLLPVIGLVIVLNFNKGQIFKMILFNLILAFMILFPFIINNCLFEVINTLINSVGKWPYVSLNAYNLWFLIFPIPFNSSFLTPHDSVSFLNISYKRVSPIFINRLGRMT